MISTEAILNNLRDRLMSGEFKPGQRLRAEELRKDYDCSASTIREILFRLSTVGLVESLEQRGFRLPERSLELQHDLTQFRILLESEGARLSIRFGGVAWEARLSAAHHQLSHIESRVRETEASTELLTLWTNAEWEFHRTLIGACRSEVLLATHETIYRRFRQQLIISDKAFVFVGENIEQHKDILEAALAHDEDLVRKKIYDHLSRNLMQERTQKAQKLA